MVKSLKVWGKAFVGGREREITLVINLGYLGIVSLPAHTKRSSLTIPTEAGAEASMGGWVGEVGINKYSLTVSTLC